jgi:outer membrane protein OmpA-like peptidoglycan-associated protein
MKILAALFLLHTAAWSQASLPIKQATAIELVEKLAPSEAQLKTRSIGKRNILVQPKSIDLMVQFDLDSAKLKESNRPLLDSLAEAMKNERLSDLNFKLEGHTDAQGSEAYNLQLSQNRAESVLIYLTSKGIEKVKLSTEGKGFKELLLPEKPFAAENRRVRITTQP